MANTFKNEVKDLTTSNQDLLAAAEVTGTGIVLTIRCTNVDGSNDATVDVEVVKASSGGNAYIAKTLAVPADTTVTEIEVFVAVVVEPVIVAVVPVNVEIVV